MEALHINPSSSLSRLKLPPNPKPKFLPNSFHSHLPLLPQRSPSPSPLLSSFQDQFPTIPPQQQSQTNDESYGEVNKIIGTRTTPTPIYSPDGSVTTSISTEYLVKWKDGHAPSWLRADYIAADVVAEYETPWWNAARKGDASALRGLLEEEGMFRDVDMEDSDGRTALHFVAGLGSEECVMALAEAGADVEKKERSGGGLTPLHVAAGYVT